jgi:Ca-activated chloride channel family protein
VALAALTAVAALGAGPARAAGILTPVGSSHQPIRLQDHDVKVVIDNGFARTEVVQTFLNPNPAAVEALYAFPLPKSASLSEVTITSGETQYEGEVVARSEAATIYETEKSAGNQAGRADKESYQRFEFRVARVEPNGTVTMRFVYYQPLEEDTGVLRYLYPLEEGGTDEVAEQFWLRSDKVEGSFRLQATLKSVWPVAQVRVPGFEQAAKITAVDPLTQTVEIAATEASLNRDVVIYYRLADDLPGRVEVVPYRAREDAPGTFMLVVTPGIDLQPITHGADYVFVLDVSGSMQGKIATLASGVGKTLGEMRAEDRFRIVTFESQARDLTGGMLAATPENVRRFVAEVGGLHANGSTNLYEGLDLALRDLDADRATSLVLVTDGVTNTGIIEPRKFHELLKQYDVRLFGFLMGNSGNWPLMRLIADTSGGFYSAVSNADDIVGQILLAKSKVTSEALHDARLELDGVEVSELTDTPGKIYRGQQLVYFGRYSRPGRLRVRLHARLTGEDKTYTTSVELPKLDQDNPELERLWALDRIETIERERDRGTLEEAEAKTAIRDLGVAYQLVTDETSMLVLAGEGFERHGIARKNRERVALEAAAQAQRAPRPARSYRVDEAAPAFPGKAPQPRRGGGGGGGAVGPFGLLAFGIGPFLAWRHRGRR